LHLTGSTACYSDSFPFVYVDDVRTSQKARLITVIALLFISRWHLSLTGSTTFYEDSFTCLYVDDVRTSQEARLVSVIALLLYL
jgi:hypothetical protein